MTRRDDPLISSYLKVFFFIKIINVFYLKDTTFNSIEAEGFIDT